MNNNRINETVITSHVFNKSIDIIWNVIKDTSLVNNLISSLKQNLASEPVLLNSSTSYEQNSTFFFYVNNHHKLLYTVKEVIETNYYCRVSFKIYSSIDKESPMLKTIHLHYIEPSMTRIVHESSFIMSIAEKREYAHFFDKEVALNKKVFTHIDTVISNNDHLKTQVESIRFKVNVDTFIKITNNFSKGSLLNVLGYECKSNAVHRGVCISSSIMNRHFSKKKMFNMRLEVDFVRVHKRGLTAKINIYDNKDDCNGNGNYNGNNNTNECYIDLHDRFIIAELTSINHNETYYSLRHQFYECVDKKTLLFVSQNKKFFLSKLKQTVESVP